jgi:hypothetical protein
MYPSTGTTGGGGGPKTSQPSPRTAARPAPARRTLTSRGTGADRVRSADGLSGALRPAAGREASDRASERVSARSRVMPQ